MWLSPPPTSRCCHCLQLAEANLHPPALVVACLDHVLGSCICPWHGPAAVPSQLLTSLALKCVRSVASRGGPGMQVVAVWSALFPLLPHAAVHAHLSSSVIICLWRLSPAHSVDSIACTPMDLMMRRCAGPARVSSRNINAVADVLVVSAKSCSRRRGAVGATGSCGPARSLTARMPIPSTACAAQAGTATVVADRPEAAQANGACCSWPCRGVSQA